MGIREIVESFGNDRENLIEILHEIQDISGDNSLHKDALEELSEIMNIPVSDIVGTATFYTMFSLKPRGKHIIRVCESPPCHIMGSDNILMILEGLLGVNTGETTEDKMFTLETSSCLGACGVAPVISINDEVYGNLTEEKVQRIVDRYTAAG